MYSAIKCLFLVGFCRYSKNDGPYAAISRKFLQKKSNKFIEKHR